MAKYQFTIMHCPKQLKRVCQLMQRLDLSIENLCLQDKITFSAENENSISVFKEQIKTAYESAGSEVVHIEGGKIE